MFWCLFPTDSSNRGSIYIYIFVLKYTPKHSLREKFLRWKIIAAEIFPVFVGQSLKTEIYISFFSCHGILMILKIPVESHMSLCSFTDRWECHCNCGRCQHAAGCRGATGSSPSHQPHKSPGMPAGDQSTDVPAGDVHGSRQQRWASISSSHVSEVRK